MFGFSTRHYYLRPPKRKSPPPTPLDCLHIQAKTGWAVPRPLFSPKTRSYQNTQIREMELYLDCRQPPHPLSETCNFYPDFYEEKGPLVQQKDDSPKCLRRDADPTLPPPLNLFLSYTK